MTDKTVQQLLEQTLEVLEERGWIQGAFTNTQGNVCLAKAFCDAAGVGADQCVWFDDQEPVQQFEGASAIAWWMLTDQAGRYPPDFNDDPETSYEDVVLLIKRSIAQADSMADAIKQSKEPVQNSAIDINT